MSAFDKIIGYDAIKEELSQICDMIRNPGIYKALGAKLPKGILIIGEPGLGKTLMAKCFIEECRLESFVIRRNGRTGGKGDSPLFRYPQNTGKHGLLSCKLLIPGTYRKRSSGNGLYILL